MGSSQSCCTSGITVDKRSLSLASSSGGFRRLEVNLLAAGWLNRATSSSVLGSYSGRCTCSEPGWRAGPGFGAVGTSCAGCVGLLLRARLSRCMRACCHVGCSGAIVCWHAHACS